MKWIFCDPLPWDYDVSAPLARPMGGSQSAMCYLAAALARRGHSVATVTGVSSARFVENVACYSPHDVPPSVFMAADSITVVLNGPGEIGVDYRRSVPGLRRLVLWTQHASDQPAMRPLLNSTNLHAWDRIVCVSEWQRQTFVEQLGIPLAKLDLIRNAIAPCFQNLFEDEEALVAAKQGSMKLTYTSTPFRGLEALANAFPELKRAHPHCELHVFSSMQVYGEEVADVHDSLYALCRATPGILYRGSLPQPQLARELAGMSILAYPNTFAETSCIAVMEALAAGLLVVTSNLGALGETTQGWARLIAPQQASGSREVFEAEFVQAIDQAFRDRQSDPGKFYSERFAQLCAMNETCTWDKRAAEWEAAAEDWLQNDG